MSINNYEEALEHFYSIGMLNEKGLREYNKVVREMARQLEIRIIDLESQVNTKKPKNGK